MKNILVIGAVCLLGACAQVPAPTVKPQAPVQSVAEQPTSMVTADWSTGVVSLVLPDRTVKLGEFRDDGVLRLEPSATANDYAMALLFVMRTTLHGDDGWREFISKMPKAEEPK